MLEWMMTGLMALILMFGTHHTPATPQQTTQHTADTASVETEWQEYHSLAYQEYVDTFTALYEGYETKWSKNGRLMLRNGDSGPYRFVKRTV